jgi:hypothetical protein
MKILDIITPHETLDENAFTDLMTKGKSAARDVANTVGEYTGIRALRTRESNNIADYVDEALTKAGKDLNRSEGLAAAERSLLDVEKTISLEGLTKKRFDQFAEYLATECKKEDRLLSSQESPILTLQELIKKDPKPPAWATSKQLNSNLFNNEYNNWLIANVNARVKIKQEVELAKTAPPAPKTKAEKEADDIASEKLKLQKGELKLAKAKLKRRIREEANAQKKAIGRFSLTYLDAAFIGSEFAKVGAQLKGSLNEVNRWEASGQLPADVAKLFPEVTATSKLPVEGGDSNDPKEYDDNEDRVMQAAIWARAKLWKQWAFQLLSGIVAFGGAQVAKGLGGGLVGASAHLSRFNNLIAWMASKSEKAKTTTDVIGKILSGMSQTSKYLFVDYFMSAANNEAWNVQDAAQAFNAVLPDAVYADLNISHTADINKAIASLVVGDTYKSFESVADSAFVKQLVGALNASYVPPGVIIEPAIIVAKWIKQHFETPKVKIDVPPIPGPIPGVGDPVAKPPVTRQNNVPPAPAPNPEVTSTAPPAPVTTNTPATTTNNGIPQRKLEETLKYKVLSRMKS